MEDLINKKVIFKSANGQNYVGTIIGAAAPVIGRGETIYSPSFYNEVKISCPYGLGVGPVTVTRSLKDIRIL